MRYQNFNVEIEGPGGESYTLRAEWRSAQPSPGRILLDQELFALQQRIANNEGVDTALLQEFGERLYKALFAGDAGALFYQSVGYARASEQGVCLRLCIAPAEAARLPWEFLYWPGEKVLLGGSREFPVVRYVRLARPIDDFKVELPLRMLVAIPDASGLNTEQEEENLRRAVQDLERGGFLELHVLKGNVTLSRISDALLKERVHVFHFIGHGEFIDKTAYLRLNLEDGGSYNADDVQICSLFSEYRTLKLVFLNSCRGATASSDEAGTGMASRLVQAGVPAVVAMQYEINDQAAVTFSREFYSALFDGSDRGRVDVAMSHARNVLQREFTGERDIGAPVLFMRTPEGALFDCDGEARRGLPFIPRREQGRVEVVARTLAQNISLRTAEKRKDTADLESETAQLRRFESSFFRNNATWGFLGGVLITIWLALGFSERINFTVDTYVVGVRDLFFPPSLHDDIMLVAINRKTEDYFHKPYAGQNWRQEHAVLIDRLAEVGARTVVFDIYFDQSRPNDEIFIGAIRRATARGTAVVVATDAFAEGRPVMAKGLAEAITTWGYGCYQQNEFGYATTVSLASVSGEGSGYRPALALAAFAPDYRIADIDFDARTMTMVDRTNRSTAKRIRFAAPGRAGGVSESCKAISDGNRVASFIVEVLTRSVRENPERRIAYENLADAGRTVDMSRFTGKIVIVARENPARMVRVKRAGGEDQLYGLDWHASVLNTMLQGAFTARMDAVPQFGIALVLALLAGACRLLRPARRTFVRTLALDGAIVVGLAAICTGLALATYFAFHLFLNFSYSFLACAVSYLVTGFVRDRWMEKVGGAALTAG